MSSRARSRASASASAAAPAPVAGDVAPTTTAAAPTGITPVAGAGSPSGEATPPYGREDASAPVAAAAPEAGEAVAEAVEAVAAEVEERVYKSFDDMSLPDDLLRGVYAAGFQRPSEIQSKAIVPISKGRDALVQAQSGMGKTTMFLTGGFCRIDPTRNEVQMIVISPTRELAEQTGNNSKTLAQFIGIRHYLATGGVPVEADLKALRSTKDIPHLLVVTPGRFYDLLKRKAVATSTVRLIVMDEADQLLDAKFKEQIQAIMSEPFIWPATTQIVLVSATMIPAIADVASSLLVRDPFKILREPEEVSLEGIRQFYIELEHDDYKLDTLCDLSDVLTIQQAVIFANSRKSVETLATSMTRRGFDVGYIHGDMDTAERKRRMEDFRAGKTRVMITTDLLARGIDIQQISLVINYELPVVRENYIHRIGRSGRYGRKGASINLVNTREMRAQEEIEVFYGKKIEPLPLTLDIY